MLIKLMKETAVIINRNLAECILGIHVLSKIALQKELQH